MLLLLWFINNSVCKYDSFDIKICNKALAQYLIKTNTFSRLLELFEVFRKKCLTAKFRKIKKKKKHTHTKPR